MIYFKVKNKETIDQIIFEKDTQIIILKEILLTTSKDNLHKLNTLQYDNAIFLKQFQYSKIVDKILSENPTSTFLDNPVVNKTLILNQDILFLDENDNIINFDLELKVSSNFIKEEIKLCKYGYEHKLNKKTKKALAQSRKRPEEMIITSYDEFSSYLDNLGK